MPIFAGVRHVCLEAANIFDSSCNNNWMTNAHTFQVNYCTSINWPHTFQFKKLKHLYVHYSALRIVLPHVDNLSELHSLCLHSRQMSQPSWARVIDVLSKCSQLTTLHLQLQSPYLLIQMLKSQCDAKTFLFPKLSNLRISEEMASNHFYLTEKIIAACTDKSLKLVLDDEVECGFFTSIIYAKTHTFVLNWNATVITHLSTQKQLNLVIHTTQNEVQSALQTICNQTTMCASIRLCIACALFSRFNFGSKTLCLPLKQTPLIPFTLDFRFRVHDALKMPLQSFLIQLLKQWKMHLINNGGKLHFIKIHMHVLGHRGQSYDGLIKSVYRQTNLSSKMCVISTKYTANRLCTD